MIFHPTSSRRKKLALIAQQIVKYFSKVGHVWIRERKVARTLSIKKEKRDLLKNSRWQTFFKMAAMIVEENLFF